MDRNLAILDSRGQTYRALVSEPIGRGVRERYAFLWRSDKVASLSPGTIYPDPDDAFIREPFAALLQTEPLRAVQSGVGAAGAGGR